VHVFFFWSYLNPFDTSFLFISKNLIGNERRRRGLAIKRGLRDPVNTPKYVPGQKRKKSGYSVFKSSSLSGEKALKLLADGHGPGIVQKEANIAYGQLMTAEKERLRKEADKENSADPADLA